MSDNTGRWLIVKDGQPVIVFTSMLDMSVTSDSALPEEPIEKGSFAMYNRTLYSDRLEVKLAIEGDNADLQRAQDTLSSRGTNDKGSSGSTRHSFLPRREE